MSRRHDNTKAELMAVAFVILMTFLILGKCRHQERKIATTHNTMMVATHKPHTYHT